jgi:GT2 family glycosyltransferase/exopolysaccharide biosynthesis predicted pyruvyltransferase EpsI
VLPQRHIESVERSRQEILQAIGATQDLTLIRGLGNFGDELIWAGTRELLRDRAFREIDADELSESDGHTALICGGGAFCHPYHEIMPHVLAVAELRFEQVILLPSTFDTSVDVVRDALERTRAVVFARERESYGRLQPLCDAHLAHDCAFFFDYASYIQAGSGILHAFRTDAEYAGERPVPPESDDISLTAGTLERWLETIASHELIRTDRAHVMIAAALLGKTVEFGVNSYFKVKAIADYALSDFPVTPLPAAPISERARARLAPAPCSTETDVLRQRLRDRAGSHPPPSITHVRDSAGAPRVTALVLSHYRPEMMQGALHSLLYETRIPVNVLVIDNDSDARTRQLLTQLCSEYPQITLHLSDHNLGCAGGRQLGSELIASEFVLFLDDDAELMPGALEHMIYELDSHPNAGAVSALVVIPDGRVSHSGGWYSESKEMASFTLCASGVSIDDPGVPESGRCDWIPGTASLIRTGLLGELPLDGGMLAYYEDTEWCLRVGRARSDCFRRSREALVLHHTGSGPWGRMDFTGRANLVRYIAAAAHFYRKHGLLLRVPGVDVFAIMPELTRSDETLDLAGARLIMELASTHSPDWMLMEWMNGGLDPVLGVERTALGNELHECRLAVIDLRNELGAARADLEAAQVRLDAQGHRPGQRGPMSSYRYWSRRVLSAYSRARRYSTSSPDRDPRSAEND